MNYIVFLENEHDADRINDTEYDTLSEFKGVLANDGVEFTEIVLLWDFVLRYNERTLNKNLFIAHIKTATE